MTFKLLEIFFNIYFPGHVDRKVSMVYWKVKSESEVAQLCPTPRDPMDCSLQGSSVCGIFQARVLEWGAIAFSQLNVSAVEIE